MKCNEVISVGDHDMFVCISGRSEKANKHPHTCNRLQRLNRPSPHKMSQKEDSAITLSCY